MRFDLYQPTPTRGDGIAFDNQTFDDEIDIAIEPGTWILIGSGLAALIGLRLWKRSRLRMPTPERPRVYANPDGKLIAIIDAGGGVGVEQE